MPSGIRCSRTTRQHQNDIELHFRLLHHAPLLDKGHSPLLPRDSNWERLNAVLRLLGRSDLGPWKSQRSTDGVICCFLPELGLVQDGERRYSMASTDLRHCGRIAELERQGVLRELLRKVGEVEFVLCDKMGVHIGHEKGYIGPVDGTEHSVP